MDQLVIDPGTGLSCPLLRFVNPTFAGYLPIDIIASPSFNDYAFCVCIEPNQFWNSALQHCVSCPNSSFTCQGDPTRNWTRLTINAGYYPIDLLSRTLDHSAQSSSSALLQTHPSTVLVLCSSQAVCNPSDSSAAASASTAFRCGFGYDPESLLCSRCPSGYFVVQSVCAECPTSFSWGGPLISVIALLVLLAALWIYSGLQLFAEPEPLALPSSGNILSDKLSDNPSVVPELSPSIRCAPVSIFLLWLQTMTVLRTIAFWRQTSSGSSSVRLLLLSHRDYSFNLLFSTNAFLFHSLSLCLLMLSVFSSGEQCFHGLFSAFIFLSTMGDLMLASFLHLFGCF
jgi:hypothetical protein